MLLLQTITSGDTEEALADAATTLSLLLSPLINNSAHKNLSQSSAKKKCYYCHKHYSFLEYFNNLIPDDAVIYRSDIPFQYNKREGMYTEFICNPTGTVSIAAKTDHKFLVSLRSNTPNMSNNPINFGTLTLNKMCQLHTSSTCKYQ